MGRIFFILKVNTVEKVLRDLFQLGRPQGRYVGITGILFFQALTQKKFGMPYFNMKCYYMYSEFRNRNSKFGIQNSEFGIQNSEFGIGNSLADFNETCHAIIFPVP